MVNNENKLNDLFNLAKDEPAQYSFEETKEQFIQSVSSTGATGGKLAHSINLKLIGMITILSALAVTAIIYSGSNEIEPEKRIDKITVIHEDNNDSIRAIEETEKVKKEYYSVILKEKKSSDSSKVELTEQESKLTELPKKETIEEVEKQVKKVQRYFEEPYRFPKLTEEEIKANNKQKAKMLKKLKLRGKKYGFTYVPSGEYNGVSVQGYFVQQTEVTNLEYRTFLFDLLINDRKDEFLIAQPDQTKWTTEYPGGFNQPMQETYFSHPAYNEYPVLAISRKGAELYCQWYSEEFLKKYESKKKYPNTYKLRLPLEIEWKVAARGGGNSTSKFGFNGESITNETDCYLANFNPERNADADGGFYTVKVNSYNPNQLGLYCMSGNAAEMVYYQNPDGTLTPGTKGGSWNSIEKELEIDGIDRWKGRTEPSVNIGFRVVMTYSSSFIK